MIVRTINIPVGAGYANWAVAFTIALKGADVVGVNECLTAKQRRLYRKTAIKMGFGSAGNTEDSPNPIFYNRKKFKYVSHKVHTLHGRGPWYSKYKGYNSERTATVLVLEDRETGDLLTVICTHWVARGNKVPVWWRRWARERARVKVARLIRTHAKLDRFVVTLGDLNVRGAYRIISGAKYIVKEGVDKIIVAPMLRLRSARWSRFDAPVDHGGGVEADIEWE